MTAQAQPAPAPKDNLLGICNALGEDFGFNPLWLRLALGAGFVIQPVAIVVGYLSLGLIVLVSRLAFPDPRHIVAAVPATGPVEPAEPQPEIEYAKAA